MTKIRVENAVKIFDLKREQIQVYVAGREMGQITEIQLF